MYEAVRTLFRINVNVIQEPPLTVEVVRRPTWT